MKKDLTMRKNTFVKGTFISTFGILLTKLLGVLYVIPFYHIIGDVGGALYGYAYTVYLFFISFAASGLPFAISKLTSEYQALGYYRVKNRAFYLGKVFSFLFGFLCFFIVFLFAPIISKLIFLKDVSPSHIRDVTFVIRIISFVFLISPILSVYRGYFEGHRFMSPPSISQVLEQFVRVMMILIGCFVISYFFPSNIRLIVSIALFGAVVGALVSYLYLFFKYQKNKSRFLEKVRDVNEPIVKNKVILKKIFVYAFPFLMIDLLKSLYNYTDMFTVVRGLVKYAGYDTSMAEGIYSMLSTWSLKFNMIVLSVSSGIIVGLIPNLSEGLIKKKNDLIQNKICLSIDMLLYICIPITFGISFLAKPIWTLFYGNSVYGPSVLSYYIFVGLVVSLFMVLITIIQVLKDYLWVFLSLMFGVLFKIMFNIRFLNIFISIGLPPYYGFITTTLVGYVFSIIICFVILSRKYHIHFESVLNHFIDILCGSFLMILVLNLLKIIIPIVSMNRFINIILILIYALFGALVYFYYAYRTGLTKKIFGDRFFKSIMNIFMKK